MPKIITISDVRPIGLTITISEKEQVNLSVRYVRLDEQGQPLKGFVGVFSRELEGGMAHKTLDFVKNSLRPFLREQEGIT